MTNKIILGSDGELRNGIDCPKEDASLYAQLPDLFLLDPANAAFIAGKKMKPVRREIFPPKRFFGSGRSFLWNTVLTFIIMLLSAGLPLGFLQTRDMLWAIELSIGLVIAFEVLCAAIFCIGWLFNFLKIRAKERAEPL